MKNGKVTVLIEAERVWFSKLFAHLEPNCQWISCNRSMRRYVLPTLVGVYSGVWGGTGCLLRHIYQGLCKKNGRFPLLFELFTVWAKSGGINPKLSFFKKTIRVMKKI